MAMIWKIAQAIFAISSIVMFIALINNINTYYLTEIDGNSLSDDCAEYEDDPSAILACHPIQQEKYEFLGGFLVSTGLMMVCYAKSRETETE